MSYAIIGFGNIGQALAKAFARHGMEVSVATTRAPESFAAVAAGIGPKVIPKSLGDAVQADIIFLAVRFEAHPEVAKALSTWHGKTIVDVTNAYGVPPEQLGGQPSSKAVAQAFTGGGGLWSRASTTWAPRFSLRIPPSRAAGESSSSRATMRPPHPESVRSRKTSASRQCSWAASRKGACWFRPAATAGAA